jgi:acyl carrier protein
MIGEDMHVLERLGGVFSDVFDAEDLKITRQSTAADVPGWDSLMHVRLILEVEKAFGVRFTTSEVASLANVGELVDAVERKVNNQPKR